MYRKAFTILASFGLLLLLTASAFGQATGGRITGTVTDANGAVVPNANVSLHHATTGHTLTTQTTDSGSYSFPNVPVGDYTVTAEGTGFQAATRALKVALNQESTVDMTLRVDDVKEVVEVTAASEALVQTDSSQLGRSYDTRQVQNLPTFGNQNALAALSPNVVEQSTGVAGTGGSVGGTRPRANSFNIDGVDNNDPTVTGPSTRVIQDAVQEFSLLTNNYNAEFGTGAGGQFNTISKSGTNEFHGSGFLYAQSQRLNAASTSEEQQFRSGSITELPLSKQARYGATLGGPIVKNKLFFFGALERSFNDRASTPATAYFAPTAAGLNQIAGLPGVSPFTVGILRERLTLAPVADAEATANFGSLFGVSGIPFGVVRPVVPSGSTDTLMQLSVDHMPNAANQFRYRLNSERIRAEEAGTGGLGFNNLKAFDMHLFSATWVRTIGTNMVNDMRLAYRRVVENYPLKDAALNDFPNIVTPAFAFGPGQSLPQGSPVNNNYQVYDALAYSRGTHNFKLGGELRRLIFSTNYVQFARGFYEYGDLEQFFTDSAPSTQIRGVGQTTFTANQYKFYGFAQDDWKVTPTLTLNLGLRYERETLPRDLAAQELNALASVPGVIEFRRPRTDNNNFAPRVGLAYSPVYESGLGRLLFGEHGQSALRANFGVSYYEHFINQVVTSLPPQFQQLTVIGDAAGSDFLAQGGTPATLTPYQTVAEARAATGALIPDQISPYSMSWTLSFQRDLPWDMALELRYLGTRGRKLPVQLQLNAANVNVDNLVLPTFFGTPTAAELAGRPTLGQIKALPGMNTRRLAGYGFSKVLTSYQFTGNSQYDGASVSLTRRFTRGLGFTTAYTWSKTIDDSTVELNSSLANPRRPQDFLNLRDERGVSALDIPHRFAASLTYELPFFKQSDNKFLKTLFGGTEINSIFQAQTGQPVTPQSNVDSNLNRDAIGDRTIINTGGIDGTSSAVRAINAAGGFVAMGSNATVGYVVVNPNAQYIQAGPGARANAGRNTLRTNGFNRTDMNVLKNFRFADERFNLQLGAEVLNLFNQRNHTLAGFATQGTLTSDAAKNFAVAGHPSFNDYSLGNFNGRLVQMRAKFIF